MLVYRGEINYPDRYPKNSLDAHILQKVEGSVEKIATKSFSRGNHYLSTNGSMIRHLPKRPAEVALGAAEGLSSPFILAELATPQVAGFSDDPLPVEVDILTLVEEETRGVPRDTNGNREGSHVQKDPFRYLDSIPETYLAQIFQCLTSETTNRLQSERQLFDRIVSALSFIGVPEDQCQEYAEELGKKRSKLYGSVLQQIQRGDRFEGRAHNDGRVIDQGFYARLITRMVIEPFIEEVLAFERNVGGTRKGCAVEVGSPDAYCERNFFERYESALAIKYIQEAPPVKREQAVRKCSIDKVASVDRVRCSPLEGLRWVQDNHPDGLPLVILHHGPEFLTPLEGECLVKEWARQLAPGGRMVVVSGAASHEPGSYPHFAASVGSPLGMLGLTRLRDELGEGYQSVTFGSRQFSISASAGRGFSELATVLASLMPDDGRDRLTLASQYLRRNTISGEGPSKFRFSNTINFLVVTRESSDSIEKVTGESVSLKNSSPVTEIRQLEKSRVGKSLVAALHRSEPFTIASMSIDEKTQLAAALYQEWGRAILKGRFFNKVEIEGIGIPIQEVQKARIAAALCINEVDFNATNAVSQIVQLFNKVLDSTEFDSFSKTWREVISEGVNYRQLTRNEEPNSASSLLRCEQVRCSEGESLRGDLLLYSLADIRRKIAHHLDGAWPIQREVLATLAWGRSLQSLAKDLRHGVRQDTSWFARNENRLRGYQHCARKLWSELNQALWRCAESNSLENVEKLVSVRGQGAALLRALKLPNSFYQSRTRRLIDVWSEEQRRQKVRGSWDEKSFLIRMGCPSVEFNLLIDTIKREQGILSDVLEKLIEREHNAILRVAYKFRGIGHSHGLSINDLYNEGARGVMRASESFDVERGLLFSTYCNRWIKQFILRSIAETNFISRPIDFHEPIVHLLELRAKNPGLEEDRELHFLAEKYNIKGKRALDCIRVSRFSVSGSDERELYHGVAALHGGVDTPSRFNPLPDFRERKHDTQRQSETRQMFQKLFRHLEYRQRAILSLRYGLTYWRDELTHMWRLGGRDNKLQSNPHPRTLKEVALLLGITPQRVSQLEEKILPKLLHGCGDALDELRRYVDSRQREYSEGRFDNVRSWPLAELDLPERALNVLSGGGPEGKPILTVADYLTLLASDAGTLKGLGSGSRRLIEEAISKALRLESSEKV